MVVDDRVEGGVTIYSLGHLTRTNAVRVRLHAELNMVSLDPVKVERQEKIMMAKLFRCTFAQNASLLIMGTSLQHAIQSRPCFCNLGFFSFFVKTRRAPEGRGVVTATRGRHPDQGDGDGSCQGPNLALSTPALQQIRSFSIQVSSLTDTY